MFSEQFQSTASVSKWQPLLAEPLRSRALEVASQVAERFREPENILAIAQANAQQARLLGSQEGTNPLSSTFGFNGVAFPGAVFAHCFPEQGWDRIVHQYLDPTKLWPPTLSHPGLFSGISGLGMVMTLMSENGKRYRKTLASLHQRFPELIKQGEWFRRGAEDLAESDYDAISGAAGVLAYLLFVPEPDEAVLASIEMLLNYLIHLTGIEQEQHHACWYISQQKIVAEENRYKHPDGYYNCGLAHGIPGPMAALSLAWLAGHRQPGLREAIAHLSDWIIQHAISDNWGINWPSVIPLSASYEADTWKKLPPTRAAWCYGAPGIARALWLAGHALDKQPLRKIALDALEAVLRRPTLQRGIDAPTLCHGIAGLLAICLRFLHETEIEIVRTHIPLLVNQILDHYDSAFPLGFRDQASRGQWVDQTGWLTGASGTALVLLAAALPIEPIWDRVLLLS